MHSQSIGGEEKVGGNIMEVEIKDKMVEGWREKH